MDGIMTDPRRQATTYVVEATSEEQTMLWCEWSGDAANHRYGSPDHERAPWEQIRDGWSHVVGELAGFPVVIVINFAIIYEELVMFYYASSRVVDHEMVESWLKNNVPSYLDNHTNSTNFGHCISSVRRKFQQKHGLGDNHIHEWLKMNGRFECERCPATKMAVAEK